LDNTSDVIGVLEVDGTVRYVSPAVERMLGYSPEEVIGTEVFDYVHPDDFERALEAFAETLKSPGVLPSMKFRAGCADGTWRHVEVVRNNRVDDPAVRGVVIDVRDITGWVRAEAKLKESEERYRTLVERIPVITYLQEPGGRRRTTYISPQYERILGYSRQEDIADPEHWARIVHPEDRERVLAEDRRTNETGEPFKMEYRQIAKDGSVVWLRDEADLVRDEDGKPLYWLGVQTDVTEHRRAEERLQETQERYRTLVERMPAVTYMDRADSSNEPIYASPQVEAMLGYTPEEWMAGRLWRERLHPDDRERVLASDERFEADGGSVDEEYRLLARDGSVVWVREETVLVGEEGGEPLFVQGILTDITKRKRAEEALRESNQRVVDILESVTDAFYALDREWRFTYLNKEAERILQRSKEELIGKIIWEEFPEAMDLVFYPEYHRAMTDGETVTFQEYYPPLKGWFELRAYPARGGISVYFRDITERKALEEQLEHQALHDPLTGLPNRTLFTDRLRQALARTKRRQKSLAVMFMDLDNFKVVNDSLGHEKGDTLLVAVSERLRSCLRPEDTLARFGGDEFTVLLEDVVSPDEAVRVAERITDELRGPLVLEGKELFVNVSIGIVVGDASTKDPESLLRDADIAMYRAKDEAIGYKVFDEAMHGWAVSRLELENDLRRAIEHEEFVVHYQPIVNLQTSKLWGLEALVRWNHPERGRLNPDEFVPIAEESGLVVPMGETVVEEACRQAAQWQREFPRTPLLLMSVNLSGRQLRRPNLHKVIEQALRESGLSASSLGLDITETVYISALDANTAALDRLKAIGLRVSIDDFGAGYSSLSYLKRLPADVLKIDKSFVRGLGLEVEDTAIVQTIVDLAHILGMEVVAEGVEVEEQETLLKEMGCDFAQGFYFFEPLPPGAVADLLAE
jgi:diguanylate cyclase (GGDEF)-like protein/PAS domain S-box-containing protein